MYVLIVLVKFGYLSGRLLGNICSLSYLLMICSLNRSTQLSICFFPHLGFWSGNVFLTAQFPGQLVPFFYQMVIISKLALFVLCEQSNTFYAIFYE